MSFVIKSIRENRPTTPSPTAHCDRNVQTNRGWECWIGVFEGSKDVDVKDKINATVYSDINEAHRKIMGWGGTTVYYVIEEL